MTARASVMGASGTGPSGALIGYVVSDAALEELVGIDPAPAIQTQRFGLVLLELVQARFARFTGYGFAPVQDFPVARKILFGAERHCRNGRTIHALPFVNLVLVKHLSRFLALGSRYAALSRCDVVFVHGLHMPYLLMASLLRLSGTRIGIVLTDQQGIVLPTDGRLRRWLKTIDRKVSTALARRFDFSLALSEDLARTYTPGRPTLILPGIYDDALEDMVRASARTQNDRFRVVYFGGLSDDYGVGALLDALPFLDPGIEIRLFGRGTLEARIAAVAASSDRLVWGGLVDRNRLAREMRDADLLVNARPATGVLARMSSPSKLIEYAASGRPVMTTRLPSLAPALIDAALTIDDETPRGIASAINAAAAMDRSALDRKGSAFRSAVRADYAVDALRASLDGLLADGTGAGR